MKLIKNYKPTGKFVEEFSIVNIREDEDVFAELPLCLVDFGVFYETAVLYQGPQDPMPIIMEKEELLEFIDGTRLFHFSVSEEGKLTEVEKEKANYSHRLPIDTPVEKLVIMQGQLGLLEEPEPEDESDK